MNAQPSQVLTSITDLPHGIHADIPAEVYHRRELGVVNAGALKILSRQTPAHYRAWVDGQDKETAALEFGRAVHCALLEPDEFDKLYVCARSHPFNRPSKRQRKAANPSDGTIKAIEYFDAWERELAGRTEISADHYETLRGMQRSLDANPRARSLLHSGLHEATAIWKDPDHGLLCKARMDGYDAERGLVVDLKTAEDASPEGFRKSVARYGYHIQHAPYASAMQALGCPARAFVFVAVEKEPPYALACYVLDAEAEGRGIELRDNAMKTLNHCLENDNWPGYAEHIQRLSLPGWALND